MITATPGDVISYTLNEDDYSNIVQEIIMDTIDHAEDLENGMPYNGEFSLYVQGGTLQCDFKLFTKFNNDGTITINNESIIDLNIHFWSTDRNGEELEQEIYPDFSKLPPFSEQV